MLIGIAVVCTSILYNVMVYIVYISKKKLNNTENKIYSLLLKMSIFGLLLELACNFFLYNRELSNFFNMMNTIVNKSFLIYMLTWELVFALYIFIISFFNDGKINKEKKEKLKKMLLIITGVYVVSALCTLIFPTYYFNDGKYIYSYGLSTDIILIIGGICIVFECFCLFKNIKRIDKKKYYPLFVLMSLVIFLVILRQINPGITIINSVFAFITVLMYFTIENPDVQMLGELYKAKEQAENSNNEKSIFLFKVTQRLREPLRDINRLSKEAITESNIEKVKENLQDIKYASNDSLALVNDVLDISELENRKIPLENHPYQPMNLYHRLVRSIESQLKNKDITFRFNYDQSIPQYLNGDSLRIKQILMTLLENALKYTEQGFIELNINGVVKYDVCRLFIVVEDSGKGMNVEQIKQIFDKSKNDVYQNQDIDDGQRNLSFVKTLVDLIGGTITVNSEIGKGTKFTVVIDQKIKEEQTHLTEAIEHYGNLYGNPNKILIVTENEKYQKTLTAILKKNKVLYDIVENGQACLEKIRNQETYQFIFMDEELPKLSSIHTFEKLKVMKSEIPVILMSDKKEIKDKDAFINMGFSDLLEVPIHKEEVNQILKKYNQK